MDPTVARNHHGRGKWSGWLTSMALHDLAISTKTKGFSPNQEAFNQPY
jgi:hypothetical protein